MAQRIALNPVARVSGFIQVEATIDNNRVVKARSKGFLFKGSKKVLSGRNLFDAVYSKQGICGVCSTAYSVALSLALENSIGIYPSQQERYLRDIVQGCDFLQNHIRHFYQYTLTDFVKLPENMSLWEAECEDFRLPRNKNCEIAEHYSESLNIVRSIQELPALLGEKVSNSNRIFAGDVTKDKITAIKSFLHRIRQFITEKMIPDAFTISHYYSDYYKIGSGCCNFLTYGCFHGYKEFGTLYVKPGVYIKGKESAFDSSKITEETDYSCYLDKEGIYGAMDMITDEEIGNSDEYSWIKAPKYNGVPCEVGPLARQWLSGEYRNGTSTMDRIIARVLEAKKIVDIIDVLFENLQISKPYKKEYVIPIHSEGAGYIDTAKGALCHWFKIDNGIINFYRIITPSAWNFSTHINNGIMGTAEQALIGTLIQNIANPVELGRIIRSFDPCVSCATHVYSQGEYVKTIRVMP